MAWRALPVLEDAAEILGAPSGYRRTGYLVGVGTGEPRCAAGQRRHAPAPGHRGRAGRPRHRKRTVAGCTSARTSPSSPTSRAAGTATGTRRRWPSPRQRGGAGPTCASTAAWPRCDVADGRVQRRPPRRRQPHRCRPRRPGGRALVRRSGRRRRRRPARPGPAGPDPPRRPGSADVGPVPVFSDLVSLQYVRSEGPAPSCWATATTPIPNGPIPTATASGRTTRSWPRRYRSSITASRASTARRSRRRTPAATT